MRCNACGKQIYFDKGIMKEDVLRAGDELIITEVDRIGRNKQ